MQLKFLLEKRHSKEKMLAHLEANPDAFIELIGLMLSNGPEGWRAVWLVNSCMEKNDKRIKSSTTKLIAALPRKADGHQRELLKVLTRMELSDKQEGRLFDACMGIWEEVGKSPSVRITAFKILVGIAKKYPEVKPELKLLADDHYTEPLSPGIKASFVKMMKGL